MESTQKIRKKIKPKSQTANKQIKSGHWEKQGMEGNTLQTIITEMGFGKNGTGQTGKQIYGKWLKRKRNNKKEIENKQIQI